MAKQIKASDLFETEDIFKGIRDSALDTIATLDKMNAEFVQLAASIKKSLGNTNFDSTKAINDFLVSQQKANKLVEQSINLQKAKANAEKAATQSQREVTKAQIEREKLEQQQIKTAQAKARADQQAAREAEKKARADERAAAAAEKEASAYAKLEAETRDLKNQSKELYAQMIKLENEGKRNTDQYRQLARTYGDVTDRAREQHQQLLQIDAAVGDNFRNVGNYTTAWQNLQMVLGTVGLAFGIQQLFTGVKGAVDEMKKLRREASMLGMEGENIDKFAMSVKSLSETFGVDQQELTLAANSMMKQFGISTEETFRILKEGYMSGANAQGDLTQQVKEYSTQMKDAGGTADTLMMILSKSNKAGIFSDKGIDVVKEFGLRIREQTKATRVAMEAAFGKDFTQQIFTGINDGSMTTVQALAKVSKAMNDTSIPTNELQTVVADVFAGPGEDAGLDYLKMLGDIDQATGNLVEKNDPFVKQMEKMEALNKRLAEVQLEFAKSLGSGSSSIDELIIKAKILFFTVFIPAVGWILKIVAAFGLLQAAIWINNGGLKVLADSFMNMGSIFQRTTAQANATATATTTAGTAAQTAGTQTEAAGRKMNAVPWVLLITLAIQFATALYDVASGASEARRQHELLEKERERAKKNAEKRSTTRTTSFEDEMKQLDRLKRGYKENGKLIKITDEEYLKRKNALIRKNNQLIKSDVNAANERKKVYKEALGEFKKLEADFEKEKNKFVADKDRIAQLNEQEKVLISKYKNRLKLVGESEGLLDDLFGMKKVSGASSVKELERKISAVNAKLTVYNGELKTSDELIKDVNSETAEHTIKVADNSSKINARIPGMQKTNAELEKMNDYMSEQNEIMRERQELESEIQMFRLANQIEAVTKKIKEAIALGEPYDISELEKLLTQRAVMEEQAILDRMEFEKQANEKAKNEAIEANNKELEDKYKKALEDAKGNKALIEKVNKENEENKKIAASNEIQIVQDYADKEKNIVGTAQKDIEMLRKKTADDTVAALEDINGAVEQMNSEMEQTDAQILADQTEYLRQQMETRNQWVQWATDYFVQQSERRIEQIEKEQEAAQDQYETLQQLAINGNINAKESLAEQQRIIDEANQRKAQEERRKQMIELASSVYQTYNNKVAEGAENPLTETIRDTVLLQQFVGTLLGSMPGFFEGTEDTGKHGFGLDGKGGFAAVLHPNERVIPKSLNDKIGAMTNEQLATLAQNYQNGTIIRGNDQTASALDTVLLVSKLDELTQTIKNKPEHNIELGEITQTMFEIIDRKKQGNTITTNRFKVRK